MKKVICIIICVIVAFTATACASNGGTSESLDDAWTEQINSEVDIEGSPDIAQIYSSDDYLPYVYYFSDEFDKFFKTEVNIESKEEWYQNGKKMEGEFESQINELLIDVCDFINEKWGKDWHSKPIKVYAVNIHESVSNEVMDYYAFYDVGHNTIFIDESFIGELEGQLRYVIAHELIHYLYEINSKGTEGQFAFPTEEENIYIGALLEEGFVDSIARKYMIDRFPKIDRNLFKSGYKYQRLNIDIMSWAVPEIFDYFLDYDFEGFEKAINSYVEERVDSKGNVCKKWANVLTLISNVDQQTKFDAMSNLFTFYSYVIPESKHNGIINRTREDDLEMAQIAQEILSNLSNQ